MRRRALRPGLFFRPNLLFVNRLSCISKVTPEVKFAGKALDTILDCV